MPTRNGMHRAEALLPTLSRSAHRTEAGASKIANLPNDIREQLNLRLLEGEAQKELAAWLNALPDVQSILASQFNNAPISEVNLTHWRQGGHLQWLTERECFDSARALAGGVGELATTGLSAERLLNVLTLRIGQLLMRWDFSPDGGASNDVAFSEVARKARILQGISRSLLAIHRIQSQSARQKSEPATSSANSPASGQEHAPSSPSTAVSGGPISNPQLEALAKGAVFPPVSKLGSRSAQSAIRNPKSAIRQILSGPILPPSPPLTLAHGLFKADLNLDAILAAV